MSAKNEQTMRRLVSSIKQADRSKTSAYDTQATVRRIEDGIAWVHIPGGVDETPVKLTIAANPGDTVQVRVSGGRAFLVGNATAPPTDDTTARAAVRQIGAVSKVVKTVQRIAEQAARIAGNTNQYFWHTESGTDTGAHITEIPQEDFLRDPENGGGNLLARSNGIAIRDGLTELAQFSADGITTCTGGAPYFNVLATGTPATSYRIKFPMSAPETRVISLPMPADRSTVTSIDVGFYAGTYGSIYRFTYGQPRTESFDGGAFTAAYDGDSTITIVYASSTERQITIDVAGDFPTPYFTFGTRYGDPGIFSASLGEGLTASGQDQTVVGKYNEADTRDGYVFIIGNGTGDTSRSNALTVDWDGNLECNNIGTYKSATSSNAIASTGIDTAYVAGAHVTLEPGVWVVTGQWPFNTGSSSGARNMSVQLAPVSGASGSGGYKMVRVTAANQSWASLEVTDIISLTSQTTVYIKASSSMTYTTATTNSIKAVRIK